VIVEDGPCFRRGDANDDGGVDFSDTIKLVNFLFLGAPPPNCFESANANDDVGIDTSDAVWIVVYLFQGGQAPPAPGATVCGTDPNGTVLAPCRYDSCP
jgi:hypothetical protein